MTHYSNHKKSSNWLTMESCTLLDCGILGYNMYRNGDNFRSGEGIVGDDVEDTIRHVGVLATEGMRETDRVILKIMTE